MSLPNKDTRTEQHEQICVEVCARAPTVIRFDMTSDGKINLNVTVFIKLSNYSL